MNFLRILNFFHQLRDDESIESIGRWWLVTLLQALCAAIATPLAISLVSQLP